MVKEQFFMEIIQFIPVIKMYNYKVNFTKIKKMVLVITTVPLQKS